MAMLRVPTTLDGVVDKSNKTSRYHKAKARSVSGTGILKDSYILGDVG
jgi:hypothetical protein